MARMGVVGLSVGLLAWGACSATPTLDGPTELRFADGAAPASYVSEYEQDIQWGAAALERDFGADYTLGFDDESGISVRLETLRAKVSTPHGQQTVDARHLSGSEFNLTISPTGGRPNYPADAPVLQMPGILEGEVVISRLMDFAFPTLPEEPVEVGDRWTARSSWPQVEAHVTAMADATIDYRLAGWETVDGVRSARIEGALRADVHAPLHDLYGATTEFSGTLEGDLTWFFDPVAGRLVGMTGETTSDGILTADGSDSAIRQHTRVRIDRADRQ